MTDTPEVAELVACPLCGSLDGYVLYEGSTSIRRQVCCAKCRQEVSEVRADCPDKKTPRTARADVAWNEAGQHSHNLALEIHMLRESLTGARRLADDRLAQMADDRAQALKWRDEVQRLRDICVNIHDGLLRGDDDKELMALAAQGWWKA